MKTYVYLNLCKAGFNKTCDKPGYLTLGRVSSVPVRTYLDRACISLTILLSPRECVR